MRGRYDVIASLHARTASRKLAALASTEAAAKEKGLQVKVGKFPFTANSKASIVDSHDGSVKIVADAKYGEILGVHIIGPQATELIAEAVTAIELEATVEEMMFTIHAHPTLAEAAGWFWQRRKYGHQRLGSARTTTGLGATCRVPDCHTTSMPAQTKSSQTWNPCEYSAHGRFVTDLAPIFWPGLTLYRVRRFWTLAAATVC